MCTVCCLFIFLNGPNQALIICFDFFLLFFIYFHKDKLPGYVRLNLNADLIKSNGGVENDVLRVKAAMVNF